MQPQQSKKWMWYILPGQVTNQGLSIVIPLYVIFLGGGIEEVAIISALQMPAVTIGSITIGSLGRY
ncbi:MAG: hypothetical protein ACREBB_00590 [Nitrosotalea sp.]